MNPDLFAATWQALHTDDETSVTVELVGGLVVARHLFEGVVEATFAFDVGQERSALQVDHVSAMHRPDDATASFALAASADLSTRRAARARDVRVLTGLFEPEANCWAWRHPRINTQTVDTAATGLPWPRIHDALVRDAAHVEIHNEANELVTTWADLEGALPLDIETAQIDRFAAPDEVRRAARHRYALPGHRLVPWPGFTFDIDAIVFDSYWVATLAIDAPTREAAWAQMLTRFAFD